LAGAAARTATSDVLSGKTSNLGTDIAGSLVGQETKDLTGSNLAGSAANILTKSGIKGTNPTGQLENLGISSLVNTGLNYLNPNPGGMNPLALASGALTSDITKQLSPLAQVAPANAGQAATSGTQAATNISNLSPLTINSTGLGLPASTSTGSTAAKTGTTSAPPAKVDVSTLTPLTSVSSLSSILSKGG